MRYFLKTTNLLARRKRTREMDSAEMTEILLGYDGGNDFYLSQLLQKGQTGDAIGQGLYFTAWTEEE